jgi:alanine racemase
VAFVLEVGAQWRAQVRARAAGHPGLVPVVKGNGYGFGRSALLVEASALGVDEVAVGTVHELPDEPLGVRYIVLTPALAHEVAEVSFERRAQSVFTVGNARDLAAADGASVIVKVDGSMHRYGFDLDDLPSNVECLHGFAVHLPLDATPEHQRTEVVRIAERLAPGAVLYVSHLAVEDESAIRLAFPELVLRQRIGTELWLGDKAGLRLYADVVDVRPVRAGTRAGYRQGAVGHDGHLVMVTAGTAHGVGLLPDGRSPFHFARTRLALHEPPHMHTSMVFVPSGDSCPQPGDRVDVQQPLTRVWPDNVVHLPLP